MDGELGCGTANEPGLSGEKRVAPWWIPVSFKTSTEIDIHWAPLEACASLEPIYTLQASSQGDPALQSTHLWYRKIICTVTWAGSSRG